MNLKNMIIICLAVIMGLTVIGCDQDADVGGDNPLEKLDVTPVATPVVTAEPEKPADNKDGGYTGENPLENLEVQPIDEGGGGYGENPLKKTETTVQETNTLLTVDSEQKVESAPVQDMVP